jgi:hypothetical protein
MWKAILKFVKVSFPKAASLLTAWIFVCSIQGQQYVIADKDDTRPVSYRQLNSPAKISTFSAIKYNGYNEVNWSIFSEQDIRRYIVEYSWDGINFQSAGETAASKGIYTNGAYQLKHQTQDVRPLLYRLRIEDLAGKFYYSQNILLDGVEVLPVKIYPTVITGSAINIIAGFPIERIAIFSTSGQQLFARDMNGKRDFFSIEIPSLGKGLYWMAFYGLGWKSTAKFIIP